MTVSSVTIKAHKLKNWFLLTFISRQDGIGYTTVEMLCSEETLRMIRLQVEKTLKESKEND